jgi:1-acyl-sn-glycerol-3-phosphate acyltransferase
MITRLFVWWFKLNGWKVGETIPEEIRKAVVIAAPHTSNWDFIYALATFRMLGIRVNYLIKREVYRFPLKSLLDNTGAIPVDRSRSHNLVDNMVERLKNAENLYLLVPAEGTRKKVPKWKSGFYHAAVKADVPLMLGYLDYRNKVAGFGKPVHLTGDKERDMAVIREFYRPIEGKHPENFDTEAIRID